MLNREWILAHLKEAKEELDRTIDKIETDEEYDEEVFEIAIVHIYRHLNTAWNERKGDINVDKSSMFPEDIAKELRSVVKFNEEKLKRRKSK